MSEYIVAIKRNESEAPLDWLDRLRSIDGVTVLSASERRAKIEADDITLRAIERAIGAFCHIERPIPHHILHD